jgi:hypothetical protein
LGNKCREFWTRFFNRSRRGHGHLRA